jgi:four helix bundle protein
VAANLAEAFRKRRYKKAFIAKLSDSEGEAAETQTWLDFARDCKYIISETCEDLNQKYENIIGILVNMIHSADQWTIGK